MSDTFQVTTENYESENLLFVHDSVLEIQNYINDNTNAIVYDRVTNSEQLYSFIISNFINVKRIAFVFHNTNEHMFIHHDLLFTSQDLEENTTVKLRKYLIDNIKPNFSRNLLFVTDLIKHYNLKNVDFLACSLLANERWKKYFNILKVYTGVDIGASDDNTGNIKHGGDWTMESNEENVKEIYFSNEITNYSTILSSITIDNIIYTFIDNEAIVTSSTELSGNVVIPEYIETSDNSYNVVEIESLSYSDKDLITGLTISKNIRSIHHYAFNGYTNLVSVNMENATSLETIGNFSFNGCNLTEIVLPNNVLSIGNSCFKDNHNLTFVKLSESLNMIPQSCFENCNLLLNIEFPNQIQTFGDNSFSHTGIELVRLPSNLLYFNGNAFINTNIRKIFLPKDQLYTTAECSFSNIHSIVSVFIPKNVTLIKNNFCQINTNEIITFMFEHEVSPQIESSAFNRELNVNITTRPDIVGLNDITTHFTNCSSSFFPSAIYEFNGLQYEATSYLTAKVTLCITNKSDYEILNDFILNDILYSVNEIKDEVFSNNKEIKNILIPSNLMYIGIKAFFNSSLEFIDTNNVIVVNEKAFSFCNELAEVTVGNNLKSLGTSAFKDCINLHKVNNFDFSQLEIIPYELFYNCKKLKELKFPTTLKTILDKSFFFCDCIETIDMEISNISTIDSTEGILYSCGSLKTLKLPNNITSIVCNNDDTHYVFHYCKNIEKIYIPNSLVSVYNMFFECNKLKSIYLDIVFNNTLLENKSNNEKKKYTKEYIKNKFSNLSKIFEDKDIILHNNINLPGFIENFNETLIYNCCENVENHSINTKKTHGKQFYVAMDNNSNINLQSNSGVNVNVKQMDDENFIISTPFQKYNKKIGDNFIYDGLNITLGSIFGNLEYPINSVFPHFISDRNAYYSAYYSCRQNISPNVLESNFFDSSNNVVLNSTIEFPVSVTEVLKFFENGVNSYVIGKNNATNKINMDVSHFQLFKKGLKESQQKVFNNLINNTYYNTFSNAIAIFKIKLINNVLSVLTDPITDTYDTSPRITFYKLGLAVFDQSDSTNNDIQIVFATDNAWFSSTNSNTESPYNPNNANPSPYTTNTSSMGIPGKKNAFSLVNILSLPTNNFRLAFYGIKSDGTQISGGTILCKNTGNSKNFAVA